MDSLLLHFVCITLSCSILTIDLQVSAETSKKDIGDVGCTYCGRIKEDCTNKQENNVPIDELPQECLFYMWNRLTVDWSYNILDTYPEYDTGVINAFLAAGKKLLLNYGHDSLQRWLVVLACCGADGVNAKEEMEGLKTYMESYKKPVMGLVFRDLEPNGKYKSTPDFTVNLKTYLGVVKEYFNDYKIGLIFKANLFMDFYTNSKEMEWLDFEEIDSHVDIFIINLTFFNMDCTLEFKDNLTPITGKAKYTMEKLKVIIEKSKIPKHKLFLMFNLSPGEGNTSENSLCYINYGEICKNPKATKNWCAESLSTFYEKGLFVREYGVAGIIADNVDVDDPQCLCKCSKRFPGFYALVDGFKCNPPPESCRLYDRC